ncbi:3',5'-cyclic adenosine monophosphate phosphodiesterase CpdA [soil metagenome]
MTQFGQYPDPAHLIAHISDAHFLGEDRPLYGTVPTGANLLKALEQLEHSGSHPEAIVFTGDLADLGEQDAYRRLRAMVEPAAERMGSQVVWVMGNHDERNRFAADLMDAPETDEPQDRVHDVNGLRIIALDSTVPGYHHGALTDAQLEWLKGILAQPAPHGTLLALHHPPIPTPLGIMALIELQGQDRLEAVLVGSDVRGILGGHLHYTTHSLFAGIPVSVAAATCYTMDLSAGANTLSGVNGAQAFNFVHVYEDRIVHSVVPVGEHVQVTGFSDLFLDKIGAMSPEQRLEVFSSKASTFNVAEVEASGSARE